MLSHRLVRPVLLGVQSLKLHALRSLLTILGVVFGVASVIVMLAVGEGAREEAVRAIEELGANNIIVRSVKPELRMGQTLGALRYGLTHDDLSRLSESIPNLTAIAPMREHQRMLWYGRHRVDGRVVAVTPRYQDLYQIRLRRGRFIEPLDVARASSVAVISDHLAENLFPISDPLGKRIRVGEDRYYVVVGITQPRGRSPSVGSGLPAQEHSLDIYIPFTNDQQRFGEHVFFDPTDTMAPEIVQISQITVTVDHTDAVKPAARVIEAVIRRSRRPDEAMITVPLDLLEKAEQTQRIFAGVLTAVASLSLLVGGIGIMNIMLATVMERTREIGIRRAIGARRIDILWQFLIETSVLSCTGGIIGILLGLIGALVATHGAGVATIVKPWSPLLAFGISVLVGLVFGMYPARRAAHMDPVEALRHQ